MSSRIFPTFEPYWNHLKQYLTTFFKQIWSNSPYFKAAFAVNIIGITGLIYFTAKLLFPELFYSEEEIAQNAPFLSFFGGVFVLVMMFLLFLSIALLVAVSSSVKYHKILALFSVALGTIISVSVIMGIF